MDVESSAPLSTVGHQTANIFASSGILHNAWAAVQGVSIEDMFVLKRYEGVAYAIFSSPCVEDFIIRDSKYGECKIQDENRAFSSCLKGNDDEPAVVHKGALRRFLYILENSDFKAQMQRLINLKKEQTIVFVGHSMAGAVATLAMIWFLEKRLRQISPFCITFGSPLVGDVRLGEAISSEDWSGKFCHVVSKYDIVPRMLLAPFESVAEPLNVIVPHWLAIMGIESVDESHISVQEACRILLINVLQYTSTIANNYGRESGLRSPYHPFGTYMFCSSYGAACIEDPEAVLKMLYFTMQSKEGKSFDEIAGACISEHTDYGSMLKCITENLHNTIATRIANLILDSSFEMGIALQLEAMGIGAEVVLSVGYQKFKRLLLCQLSMQSMLLPIMFVRRQLLKGLLDEFGRNQYKMKLLCDSQSVIYFAKNPTYHKKVMSWLCKISRGIVVKVEIVSYVIIKVKLWIPLLRSWYELV